jgi:hypothetical protein
MRLSFKRYFSDYGPQILEKCGYRPFRSRYNPETVSYVRILADREFYPRFHVYVETDVENEFTFTIHLDQKMCSYEGVNMHAGEYETETSPALDAEVKRLEGLINSL